MWDDLRANKEKLAKFKEVGFYRGPLIAKADIEQGNNKWRGQTFRQGKFGGSRDYRNRGGKKKEICS